MKYNIFLIKERVGEIASGDARAKRGRRGWVVDTEMLIRILFEWFGNANS